MPRIWSKKIIHVLQQYENSKSFIFGITGDIDNLGIFVSEQGRPLAENLVDVYNRIIGSAIKEYIKQQPLITDFAFIPSGEEIFAIGICAKQETINDLFAFIKSDMNNIIKRNCIIDAPYVSISFGYKIFDNITVGELLDNIRNNNVLAANQTYLKIMQKMREDLAIELDKSKFASLKTDEVIFFRNCVYAKMREYKRNTKQGLIKIANLIKNDPDFIAKNNLSQLTAKYGIDELSLQKILDIMSHG